MNFPQSTSSAGRKTSSRSWPYLAAFGVTILATLLRLVLHPVLNGAEAFDVHYVAVALVAWRYGWKPAAVALLTSVVVALWYFVPPYHAFFIHATGHAVPLLTFLMVGGLLLGISEMLHRAIRCAEQSARELAHQKEEYQSSFELSVVGQAQVDPVTGRFLRVNGAFCRITGYSKAELLEMTFVDITHPDDKERDFEGLRKLRSGEISCYTSEKRYLRKDGATVCVKMDITMLRDQDGNPLRTIGIFEDITERKEAEDALRKSQSLLVALAENSPAVIFIKDIEGRHLLMNHQFEKVFHRPKAELVGTTDFDLFPAKTAERLRRNDQLVCQARKALPFEESVEQPDGIHHYTAIEFPLFDERGNIYAVAGVAIEITARLEMEKALKESEERLYLAQEAANAGVWDWDLKTGKIIWTGITWKIYGLPRKTDEVSHELWSSFLHPDDRARAGAVLEKALAQGEHYRDEFRVLHPDGVIRWLISRGKVTREPSGKAVRLIGITMDITYLKQVEQELQVAQRQLTNHARELERQVAERTTHLREAIRSLELLLYNIAHHLRAPNRAMEGFAELLLNRYSSVLDATGRDYVERIAAAASRNDALIFDLLEYGRLVHADLPASPLKLEDCVREVLDTLAPSMRAKQALVDVESPLPCVAAHPAALKMVLSQLLGNALKFSSPERAPKIRIRSELQSETVRVFIEDNGIGIQQHHIDKIFKVFERLHGPEDYPGTGIGLALVEKAITRMGGHVGAESQFGQGSCFWFELPQAEASKERRQAPVLALTN